MGKVTENGVQRLDRPPLRVYVKLDELGPHVARTRKSDAVQTAEEETECFGEGRIYEYRLVDTRPRAVVKPAPMKSANRRTK